MAFPKHHSQAGMTFIEVLVVMFIAAIVLGTVAVTAGGAMGNRLITSCGKFMAAIRYTYDLAALKGKPHQLVVDNSSGKYWIEMVDLSDNCEKRLSAVNAGEESKGEETKLTGEKHEDMLTKNLSLPRGVEFKGVRSQHNLETIREGEERILFFPDGTAEKAFVWIGRDDEIFTVEVSAIQGRGILHREELDGDELEKR